MLLSQDEFSDFIAFVQKAKLKVHKWQINTKTFIYFMCEPKPDANTLSSGKCTLLGKTLIKFIESCSYVLGCAI